jgi:hypothetical protein
MVPPRAGSTRPVRVVLSAALVIPALVLVAPSLEAETAAGQTRTGVPISLAGSAVVHLGDLARIQARLPAAARPPVRPLTHPELNEEYEEPPSSFIAPAPERAQPMQVQAVSPSPSASFIGLDDIPMADSSYIIIPPDVNGAVGPTKIFQNLNNNVRILNKTDGSVVSTVGVNTFWAPTGASPNNYTDPRTVFDPYNGRWIAIMQGDLNNNTGNSLVIGLSDTNDPSGSWHLYRTILYESSTRALADFPTLGFNKNWITVSINMYKSSGSFTGNSVIAIHYPSLRTGTFTGYRFDNTDFCAAPCQTYSATSDTEYVLVHQSSAGATYRCDQIRGLGPAAPTYTLSGTLTRTGGGWASGSGQTLPQSAPISGTSSCGATPCKIELIDAYVRTPPVFRAGSIWYAQTIGLPATGLTHTAAQWTRITTPSGAYVDGGRIEDPTATATNGGKWYAYPQLAVNAQQNFLVTFSQFSSAQHPSAGYSVHVDSDGPGTIRDPYITKPGGDYYHKDFGSGRNRWGDFSSAQVDPSDDMTLWAVGEYAKTRVGTDDGTSGTNSSRWSTWWASVLSGTFTITASAGPNGSITPSGPVSVSAGASQGFTITPNACCHIFDVQVDGSSVGPVTSYTFSNVQASHTITATFVIDTHVINASAGAGGTISPSGPINVNCGASQGFTIAANTGSSIADVLVDGSSVGAVTGYTFNNVTSDHTIAASFASDSFTVTTAVTGLGTVQRVPDLAHYLYGASVSLTATPTAGWGFLGWSGDTATTADPLMIVVRKNWNLTAAFADSSPPVVQVLAPAPHAVLTVGNTATLGWSATDNVSVSSIDLLLSRTGAGGPYDSLAFGLANTGSYDWIVTGPPADSAFLEVVAHDAAGLTGSAISDTAFTIVGGSTAVLPERVTEFRLEGVVPQPSHGAARLRFALPRRVPVRMTVHDVQGREVAVLADGTFDSGLHEVVWNDPRTGSGLYFVRLVVPGHTFVERVVRVR